MIQHLFVPAAGTISTECCRCSELPHLHGQETPLATCAYCSAYSTFKHTSAGPLWFLPCSCGLWGPGETANSWMAKMDAIDPIAELLRLYREEAIRAGLAIVRLRLELKQRARS